VRSVVGESLSIGDDLQLVRRGWVSRSSHKLVEGAKGVGKVPQGQGSQGFPPMILCVIVTFRLPLYGLGT